MWTSFFIFSKFCKNSFNDPGREPLILGLKHFKFGQQFLQDFFQLLWEKAPGLNWKKYAAFWFFGNFLEV